jgi:hypothetical protein
LSPSDPSRRRPDAYVGAVPLLEDTPSSTPLPRSERGASTSSVPRPRDGRNAPLQSGGTGSNPVGTTQSPRKTPPRSPSETGQRLGNDHPPSSSPLYMICAATESGTPAASMRGATFPIQGEPDVGQVRDHPTCGRGDRSLPSRSIRAYHLRQFCEGGTFSSKSPIITPSGSWNIANVPTPGSGIGSMTIFPPSSSAFSRLARRSSTLT